MSVLKNKINDVKLTILNNVGWVEFRGERKRKTNCNIRQAEWMGRINWEKSELNWLKIHWKTK